MTKRAILVLLGVIAVVFITVMALGAPHSKKSQSTKISSQTVITNQVTIQNFMFNPTTIAVKAGTTVTWTNADSVHHNIVADNPSMGAPNGPLIGQGEQHSFTFTKKGTYTLHCTPHPYMHGEVVVN